MASSTTVLLHSVWPASASQDPGLAVKLVDLAYTTLYLLAGAYTAAWISGNITAPLAIGILFSVLGIITLVAGLDTVNPVWYQVYIILVSIPATYFGGKLRLNRIRSHVSHYSDV